MDLILLIGIAVALLVILVTLFFLQKKSGSATKEEPQEGQVPARGGDRRAQIARNQRNRLRNNADVHAPAPRNQQRENEEQDDTPQAEVLDEKMGAKKRAKMEAKAEKKAVREAELKSREERKKKDALEDEERKRQVEKEAEEERKVEEAEKQARLEKERKEQEEYMKMKAAFTVDEEGFEEGEDDEKENLLAEFIQYIKDNKVVILEELAIHFKLKTQQVIDRITDLQESGSLTGVIDDRGKFIYISEDELKSVAKFIKQRGRVSISELAESSATLINLVPVST